MIFLVEDDPSLRRLMAEFFKATGLPVDAFETAEAALAAAKEATPDVVVSDLQLPGMSGLELVAALGQVDPGIARLVMTAHGSVQNAVAAIKAGAFEFIEKPVDLERLRRIVERALAERRTQRELAWVRGGGQALPFLGESPAMQAVQRQIEALRGVGTEAPPVLVLGETGVGKGVVARAVHQVRFGPQRPWIEVNCAALPASLVEAELFGYERSAFTDARQAKPGLFEAATGGTLFLDEIGELGLEVQAKLLKILESRSMRRLGAVRDRAVDVAVVAASNVALDVAAQTGKFRADLFHRLAAIAIRVPPLRERGNDAVLLARAFLTEAAARYRRPVRALAPALEEALVRLPWPGNVRELRFAVERAVLLAPPGSEVLTTLEGSMPPAPAPAAAAASISVEQGVKVTLPPEGVSFDDLEQAVLKAALAAANGNATQAAKLLHLTRDAIRYRLRKFGLDTHTGGG